MALHFAEYYGSALFGFFGLISAFCLASDWKSGSWGEMGTHFLTTVGAFSVSGLLGLVSQIS